MTLFLYIAVGALFILLTVFRLFAEGMFVDGVTYAAISRNLADGLGSFWQPHLSATLYPQFHEHPPLAFGMEGMAYRVFGDSLMIERFYSIFTFFITGYLIVLIWKVVTGNKKTGWLPLLIWILFPLVTWAAASNLLDNTLSIFTTLSILLILKGSSRNNPLFLMLAGLSLFAGLLTKGPFALFPWVLPALWEYKQLGYRIKKSISNTLILVSSTLLPLIILFLMSSEALDSLRTYWNTQVVASLDSVKTVTSRFYILSVWLLQLIIPLIFAGICGVIFRKHLKKDLIQKISRPSGLLLIFGLCGVIPIMISMKQSSFYILSSLPVFALAIALPISTFLTDPLDKLQSNPRFIKIFKPAAIFLLAVSIAIPILFAPFKHRDHKELVMIHEFSAIIPAGTTIRIPQSIFTDWSLQSYFARLCRISLDPSDNPAANFYLSLENEPQNSTIPADWIPIRRSNGFVLFKK
jgi:4-amino-4-deoxy-L-arabinose transferase-like glycosyltransferase